MVSYSWNISDLLACYSCVKTYSSIMRYCFFTSLKGHWLKFPCDIIITSRKAKWFIKIDSMMMVEKRMWFYWYFKVFLLSMKKILCFRWCRKSTYFVYDWKRGDFSYFYLDVVIFMAIGMLSKKTRLDTVSKLLFTTYFISPFYTGLGVIFSSLGVIRVDVRGLNWIRDGLKHWTVA